MRHRAALVAVTLGGLLGGCATLQPRYAVPPVDGTPCSAERARFYTVLNQADAAVQQREGFETFNRIWRDMTPVFTNIADSLMPPGSSYTVRQVANLASNLSEVAAKAQNDQVHLQAVNSSFDALQLCRRNASRELRNRANNRRLAAEERDAARAERARLGQGLSEDIAPAREVNLKFRERTEAFSTATRVANAAADTEADPGRRNQLRSEAVSTSAVVQTNQRAVTEQDRRLLAADREATDWSTSLRHGTPIQLAGR